MKQRTTADLDRAIGFHRAMHRAFKGLAPTTAAPKHKRIERGLRFARYAALAPNPGGKPLPAESK